MPSTPAPHINTVTLRDLLLKHVVSDDLRGFCFELHAEYESIVGPNDKLPIAIINVIQHFDKHTRLPEFIACAQRHFQNADWPSVTARAADPTATPTSPAAAPPPRQPGPLRIFLCHAREDKPAVRELYQRFRTPGFAPWLDDEDLEPGQKWRVEIPKAIANSDVILVCLSPHSVGKSSYIKSEMQFALDNANKQPPDAIFIIPVLLEACEVPSQFADYQWVNLFDLRGFERLQQALARKAKQVGASADELANALPAAATQTAQPTVAPAPLSAPSGTKGVPLPDPLPLSLAPGVDLALVRIPAGTFLMGSDESKDPSAEDNELPQHSVYVSECYIGKFLVTRAEWAAYAKANNQTFNLTQKDARLPVSEISWTAAAAFCTWASAQTGRTVQLPTEAAWEKAARGPDGRIYPWGDVFDAGKANTGEGKVDGPTAVGAYSKAGGDSPYGVADMVGNLWEWCADYYGSGEYAKRTGQAVRDPTGPSTGTRRVLRGGAWYHLLRSARCAVRSDNSDIGVISVGFRVVVLPDSSL